MFGLFGRRRRDIARTALGIDEVATLLQRDPPGFIGLMMADGDFAEDREAGDPSSEEIKRMNFQMLAASYMLRNAKNKGGDAGFRQALSLIPAALCLKIGLPVKQEKIMLNRFIQYYEAWEPYLEVEDSIARR